MKNKTFILFVLLCVWNLTGIAQTPFLEPNLTGGKYPVGFKVFHEYDYSRTAVDTFDIATMGKPTTMARPIQISVWYPAGIEKTSNPMPFKNYIDLMATQINFDFHGDPLQHPFVKEMLLNNPFIKKDQLEMALATKSKATRDAIPQAGSFPVLIYAPGSFGPGFENSTMFEYLASHGFIVASFPKGINLDPTHQSGQNNLWVFEPHARDMEYVIAFMHKFPNANMNKLGLLGYSLGASTIINVASRNREVKAVVSLDGLFNEAHMKSMPFLDLKMINMPFFDIAANNEPSHKVVYDSITNQDAYRLVFNKFGHAFFGSCWILLSDHHSANWYAVKGTQSEINLGYRVLSEQVLHFFDAYLNGNKASIDKMKLLPESTHIPVNFLSFESKEKGKNK